ncbi:alpha/beta hydrolase [Lewinella sp. W8]|uniref:alpha/beta hydrolase n=1 Tax=Lewinella sp. W8 TaxID=2528208 RepID=UPI0010674C57|nr:alpha/beta hydrolase-fold protein [Lewinella sp. W8]MTB53452.1 hypothetical protein [Lewinella sp. W8]
MRLVIAFFLLMGLTPVRAQDTQPLSIEHTITSQAFGDERKVTVYLPPNYYNRPEVRYTVTYVLDGHYAPFIDLVVKTLEYNVNARKITPTIVVGIHARRRGQEFTMPMSPEAEREGRADALQQHFRDEVFPLIDSLYPDRQEYRSIIGHSSGGLFVLHTLFGKAADLFDGYVAISPALRPGNNNILPDATDRLAQGKPLHKFLYCSAGTVGEREELFGGAVKRIDALLQSQPDHGLYWEKTIFEGLDHWSVVGPSVLDGALRQTRAFRADMKNIVDFARDGSTPLKERLDAFYAKNKSKYGFADLPSDRYLRSVSRELERLEHTEQAVALMEWSLGQYPDNFRLTKEHAMLLASMGKIGAARKGFGTCLSLLKRQKEDMDQEVYAANVQDIEERLAKLK